MVRDRSDFAILLLACLGCALIVGGVVGLFSQETALYLSVVGLGLPLVPGWWWHTQQKRRADNAEAETKETTNYARYLANQEKERALSVPVKVVVPTPPDYTPGWRVALHRFVTAGEKHGFDIRKLAQGQYQVVAWDDWAVLVNVLKDAGVLVGHKTRWNAAGGWNWTRWEAERATLALPHPNHAAPEVALTVNNANNNSANNAPRVVEAAFKE